MLQVCRGKISHHVTICEGTNGKELFYGIAGPEKNEVLHKTHELLAHGVTEADISDWILKGADPHGLGGASKSVFKCALIFQSRVKLAKILLGDEAPPSDMSYKTLVEPLVWEFRCQDVWTSMVRNSYWIRNLSFVICYSLTLHITSLHITSSLFTIFTNLICKIQCKSCFYLVIWIFFITLNNYINSIFNCISLRRHRSQISCHAII